MLLTNAELQLAKIIISNKGEETYESKKKFEENFIDNYMHKFYVLFCTYSE